MNFVKKNETQIREKHMLQFLAIAEDDSQAKSNSSYTHEAPQDSKTDPNIFDIIEDNEKQMIIDALLKNKGNVTLTAKHLDMSRSALNYRMRKYDLFRKTDWF